MVEAGCAPLMSDLHTPRDLAALDLADSAALERCLAGDRGAFAELVSRHAPGIFALCARMAGPAVGEELAQEAFTRAYASLGRFRRDAQFRHWLYRIALNLCRDHLKSGRSRETATDFTLAEARLGIESASPVERACSRQTLEALEEAIERLPEKYRESFVLKHVENLSYEEMEEIVGMAVGALKVRVHRAREMLREALGDLLDE